MRQIISILLIFISLTTAAQQNEGTIKIGLLKYNGGGDWYSNLETSLPNLIQFTNEQIGTNINSEQTIVEVGSVDIFNFPLIHMTGHGNVIFNTSESENLRKYLTSGGFLHIDDNYGMDKFIRNEMKKVFPELDFIELPHDFPIYHQSFNFVSGPPKIHEHDNKPAKGLGLIYQGRLVCYYTVECDLGDGWEDPSVHNDPEDVRLKALKMGSNILEYVFLNNNIELD